jgi:hypothetical protein
MFSIFSFNLYVQVSVRGTEFFSILNKTLSACSKHESGQERKLGINALLHNLRIREYFLPCELSKRLI